MEDDPPEFVDEVPESGSCWVIDPIDGTTNYVRGVQPWATAVSAVVDGEPVAAANYLPVADEMYATRGDGAARDGDPIAVSDRTDPGVFVTTPLGKLEDIDTRPTARSTAPRPRCSATSAVSGACRLFSRTSPPVGWTRRTSRSAPPCGTPWAAST
jgi:hypothetical protein